MAKHGQMDRGENQRLTSPSPANTLQCFLACVTMLKHDMKHTSSPIIIGVPTSAKCFASVALPLVYTDFRSCAAWRRHPVTHDMYLNITPPEVRSPWCAVPSFNIKRCHFDLMHTVHLGVGKDLAAQIAFELCSFGYLGGGSLDDQLMILWLQFRRWARKHKLPFNRRFDHTSIGMPKETQAQQYHFPEMSSRVKAAQIKPLLHFLAYRCREVLSRQNPSDMHAGLRAWTAWGMSKMLYVFDSGGNSYTCYRLFHALFARFACMSNICTVVHIISNA